MSLWYSEFSNLHDILRSLYTSIHSVLFEKESNKKFKMKTAVILLAAAAAVSAHSTWQDLWVGSTDKGTSCARTVKDNNPIASLTSSDMFCGRGPASSANVCEVAGTPFPHTQTIPKLPS